MPWAAAAAVAGAAISYEASSESADSAEANSKRMAEAQRASGQAGLDSSIFYMNPDRIATTIAALTNAKNANPTDIEKQQLRALSQSNDINSAMWQRYQQVYQPLQDQVVNDAKNLDSSENQEIAAGKANAGVTEQYAQQRQASLDRLRSMGVNPSSDAFVDASNRSAVAEAASNAGAQNAARENLRTQGRTYRATVAGTGAQIPQQVQAGLNANGNALGNAASGVRTGRAADNSSLGNYLSPLVSGVGDWLKNQNGGTSNSDTSGWNTGMSSAQMDQWANNASNDYASFSPSTNADGYMADGGVVRAPRRGVGYMDGGQVEGPGTGTSDSVQAVVKGEGGYSPIRLSKDEVIVPADVVRAKGVEFFNKLIEKYHTPVRRGVRR